jgi:hypothetical protein
MCSARALRLHRCTINKGEGSEPLNELESAVRAHECASTDPPRSPVIVVAGWRVRRPGRVTCSRPCRCSLSEPTGGRPRAGVCATAVRLTTA